MFFDLQKVNLLYVVFVIQFGRQYIFGVLDVHGLLAGIYIDRSHTGTIIIITTVLHFYLHSHFAPFYLFFTFRESSFYYLRIIKKRLQLTYLNRVSFYNIFVK